MIINVLRSVLVGPNNWSCKPKTRNTFSVVRKVTNLLGEGLCLTVRLILAAGMSLVTVDVEVTADDDDVGMGFSGGGKS